MIIPTQSIYPPNQQMNWGATGIPYDNYSNRNNQQVGLQNYLKCRPVSSIEEARAFQIDLDGSLWVFTDVGNGRIYTKQINNDGTATFNTYGLIEQPKPVYNNSSEYVTKKEFNEVVQSLMVAIQNNNVSINNNQKKEPSQNLTNF